MAQILPIRRKTVSNQSIDCAELVQAIMTWIKSMKQSINKQLIC